MERERGSSGCSKGRDSGRHRFKYECEWRSVHEDLDERASGMEHKVNSKIHRPIASARVIFRICLGAKTDDSHTRCPTPFHLSTTVVQGGREGEKSAPTRQTLD